MNDMTIQPKTTGVAIRVSNLSKCYHIYDRPHDRLKQSLYPRMQRLVCKPPIQYFHEFWALKDVSFEVSKGETVGIIGRNGSGKSTLLQLLCGTLSASAGEIKVDGRVAALLELGAGFNPEFTGRENVYMNAAIYGLSQDEITQRFAAIEAFAEIGEFIEQPVKLYSSGMFVRLAFAVIAHLNADVLIIDEALAVGDAVFTQKCMRFLRDFAKRGTLFFVSHDTSAVLNLCSRAVWLDHGVVQANGEAREVVEAYHTYLYECQAKAVQFEASHPVGTQESGSDDADLMADETERAFGMGGVSIVTTRLVNTHGQAVTVCVGGESVRLTVSCNQHQVLGNLIVGFAVKDRLGQVVFAENTLAMKDGRELIFPGATRFSVSFAFEMPFLAAGEYVVDVAVAEGTQLNHLQHHWIYGALVFRSIPEQICHGVVRVPMSSIQVESKE